MKRVAARKGSITIRGITPALRSYMMREITQNRKAASGPTSYNQIILTALRERYLEDSEREARREAEKIKEMLGPTKIPEFLKRFLAEQPIQEAAEEMNP